MDKAGSSLRGLLFFSLLAIGAPWCPAEGADEVELIRTLPSEVNLSRIERIAVTPLSNDPTERLTNLLGVRLQQTGQFELLERSQLDNLLAEHNFSLSGLVDESSAVEVGQILGVEALVYGSVNVFRVYDEGTQERIYVKVGEETYTDKKGKTRTRDVHDYIMAPAVVRRGELELTVKVVDVTSGLIIAQKNERQTFEDKKVNHPQAEQNQLPSQGDIEQRLIDAALTGICRYVAPYQVEEEVRWDGNCKMDECDEAFRYVELGMLDEAEKTLEQRLTKTLKATKKRKERKGEDDVLAALYYNTGLVAELKGEMEKALEMYMEALKARIKDPAEKQKEARERVEQYIGAWQAYNSQVSQ